MTSTHSTAQSERNSTAAWRAADLQHHMHPFTDYKSHAAEGGSRIITRAEGVWLEDSEGQKILDGMAGLWCVNAGYGRQELAEAAYRQMQELPYYNTFFKTATPPSIELAEKLASLTPEGLDRFFYGTSGSEANDTVIRMVRRFWRVQGKTEKTVFISRVNAYHGSTLGGASLGGMQPMHEMDGLPLPDFVHIDQPHFYQEGAGRSAEDFGLAAAQALEAKIEELGAERVAAFIGEPVQGAGGVIVPPESYWPEIQRICRKHDVLLVADEVICGFGRTGQWFGSQTFDIAPDIMPMAKGLTSGYLPLSAVAVGDRVAGLLHEVGGEFAHGYTYAGHPASCAVALANIAIIEREGLVERVREAIGPHFKAGLESLADHPLVGEVRCCGLMAGIELAPERAARKPESGEAGQRCRDRCMANNLVCRPVGDAMVLSPPLTITEAEVDDLVARLSRSLDETAKALGVS